MFTLMLQNGLFSPGGATFSKPIEEMSKHELNRPALQRQVLNI